MKSNKILDSLYYTFNPTLRQIKFADQLGLKHKDILLVINLSRSNQMIFNFGSAIQGGSFANGVLTLVYDTTSMAATDDLRITVTTEDEELDTSKKILQELRDQRLLWNSLLTLNTEDSILGAVISQTIRKYSVKDNDSVNINTATTTTCKIGNGTFVSLVVNDPTGAAITIYDSVEASGKIIATVLPLVNTSPFTLAYNIKFTKGLTVLTAGTPDITIIFT